MSATVSDRVRIYGSNLHFCIEEKGIPDSKGYAPTEDNPTGYLSPKILITRDKIVRISNHEFLNIDFMNLFSFYMGNYKKQDVFYMEWISG